MSDRDRNVDLEAVYAALAEGIDAHGPEHSEMFLAKAALHAGFRLLMDKMELKKVDRVVLAGAFGTHIDPKYAMVMGMIPDCELENVRAAGNSAGTGARMALLNKGARREIEAVVRDIEKIETAVEASFQDQFVKAMAIPHKSEPYEKLGAAVELPERILTPDEAPAIESGRRRGGRRRRVQRRTRARVGAEI